MSYFYESSFKQDELDTFDRADGKVVEVRGKKYKVQVSRIREFYSATPQINIWLDPQDKQNPEYLEVKRELKDDWGMDLFGMPDIEQYCEFMAEMRKV